MRMIWVIMSVSLLVSCFKQDVKQKNSPFVKKEMVPIYLYKVISITDWENSCKEIRLSDMDAEFIHLSMEDQLDRILKKYWSNVDEYVLIKLESSKLPGELAFEANPNSTNKYYHLYHGSIPFSAIVELHVKKSAR